MKNIIVLTPDGVGSTLLQRVITVYMNLSDFDRNIVNLHELTNGLTKYFSDTFNQWMLRKDWDVGYSQSLPEIISLLESVEHYKTSRVAHYHLKRRNDDKSHQLQFYRYLNENFYIISAQRKNVFEQALNWGIRSSTGKLNVYSHDEKIDQLIQIKDKISIPTESFQKYLNNYKEYLEWVALYFDVNSFFNYEDHAHDIQSYVHNLDIFSSNKKETWESLTGIEWQTWNRCHKLLGDGLLASLNNKTLLLENKESSTAISQSIPNYLPVAEQEFLNNNISNYVKGSHRLKYLVDEQLLPGGIPIKMHTMLEKKMLVKNFDQLLDVYNSWASINDFEELTYHDLKNKTFAELSKWYDNSTLKLLPAQ